jgi:hypothetical protein
MIHSKFIARSVAPSATSGRKRSVLLLAMSVAVALIFQYGLAPNIDAISWQYFVDAWASGCGDESSFDVCAGNAGVYRAAGAAFLLYFIFGIGEYR